MSFNELGEVPKKCQSLENGSGSNNQYYNTYVKYKNSGLKKCLEELKIIAQKQNSQEHRQQQTIVGTATGAGGLACGLGLFPCLVKLVTKLKG